MKKFPKVRYPSDSETDGIMAGDVVVTEKLDGANFRFTFTDNGAIKAGSRNVKFTEDGDPLPIDEVNHDFRHAIKYLRETVNPVVEDMSAYTFYGEAMHLHSLAYDDIDYGAPDTGAPHPTDAPNVVLFDARVDGEWVDWDRFIDVADELHLPTTDVIERGDPDDLSLDIPDESMFGGTPEGIVVRRLDGSVRAKKVRDNFTETNATSFNDPSKAQSDAAEFVAMYVTDARIEKMAHKLRDEGDYDSVQMPMMEDLPRAVLSDVMAEEGWDLLTNDFEAEWDGDFKSEVRSKASKKCARVLKTMCNSF